VVSSLMGRMEALNELYKPQAYLADLTKLVFAELDNHKKVTPYRKALQDLMCHSLIIMLGNGNQTMRPAILYTLKQLEKKTKAAAQSTSDQETRAHWANLYDQIGERLTWN